MERDLSLNLHVLVARLDRMADRILRAEHNISYSRFLALTLVGELGLSTQRALADGLGVTEPSVSRMTGVLAAEGLLDVQPDPAGGNRRQLSLTDKGKEIVASLRQEFEDKLAALVAHSGVPYAEFAQHTARLLATLDQMEQESTR
ncbi:MarR family transcriptional regulator [Nonomuraea sp. LP-02]|uniref:MarR family winged helix-turn-helix transcriptional regulator n=1 Tax=Nonomuraea sp. LP-02 TaxID=3097960 RepID=UPI002E309C07|nr:MarR family transcriptional regulator [Nonomuraea sp. LP-02]MED7923707.1 MarR family transcriptional regulator [Nonomuraea sp. LP-02]